jgi:hypothetical protein
MASLFGIFVVMTLSSHAKCLEEEEMFAFVYKSALFDIHCSSVESLQSNSGQMHALSYVKFTLFME